MLEILALGFLIGLQHALEADHLMAMASLASGGGSLRALARSGMVWGVGHTLTLLALGGAALALGSLVPGNLAALLEFGVGLMLVMLGAQVLHRLLGQRVHRHRHAHADHAHRHAHTHAPCAVHGADAHRHPHPAPFPLRALCVGMMHGMAGSAAIVVLALHAVHSPLQGLLYILVFGAGSIAGMGALGMAIGLPLGRSAAGAHWSGQGLNALVGCCTTGLGFWVMYSVGIAL